MAGNGALSSPVGVRLALPTPPQADAKSHSTPVADDWNWTARIRNELGANKVRLILPAEGLSPNLPPWLP